MLHTSHTLSLSGLRSVHNARTRIYGVGRDPVFDPPHRRAQRPFGPGGVLDPTSETSSPRLLRRDWLDRLEPPLTRRRD